MKEKKHNWIFSWGTGEFVNLSLARSINPNWDLKSTRRLRKLYTNKYNLTKFGINPKEMFFHTLKVIWADGTENTYIASDKDMDSEDWLQGCFKHMQD